jgi:hypothetical protein
MADPKHLEILQQGSSAWDLWRTASPDITPDLSNANLRRVDFHSADLIGVDFSGANLQGACLTGCSLAGAHLSGPI